MRLGLDRRGAAASRVGSPRADGRGLYDRVLARIDYRIRTLGVAALLALVAGALTLTYVQRQERRVELAVTGATVLVATRDIPAGTAGSDIVRRGLIQRREVPRRAVVPGAFAKQGQIAGLVAAEAIYTGEQISVRRFRSASEQGLRGELGGTARAIWIPGQPHQVLAGIARAGDRVDVLAAIAVRDAAGHERLVSNVLLRDVRVLRGADESAASGGAVARSGGGASVALALSDRQAQKLFLAMRGGHWWLVLRPARRASDSPAPPLTAESLLVGR